MLKLVRPTLTGNVWIMITGDCTVSGVSITRLLRSAILFTTLLFTVPAAGAMFIGAKLGPVMVDTPSSSDPINIAVNLGYEIDTLMADLSLTGEINRTVSRGETNYGDELMFESNGIYLVFKTTRSFFVTFRGGVVQNKIIAGSTSRRNNGISLGGGIGMVVGRTRVQIEYTSITGDANYLSLGLEF